MRRLICAAAAITALAACSGRPEEKTVTPVQTMTGPEGRAPLAFREGTAIPPIDRETPARLETATFAVG